MTVSVIDDLELSVRTSNVLRRMGVTTLENFMSLERRKFLAQKNAGIKSWREIEEVRYHLRRSARRQTVAGRALALLEEFNFLADDLARLGYVASRSPKHPCVIQLLRTVRAEDLDEELVYDED